MTFKKLIEQINHAYPDGLLMQTYEERNLPEEEKTTGDGLAEFIVNELSDIYNVNDSSQKQKDYAAAALSVAVDELNKIIFKLNKRNNYAKR